MTPEILAALKQRSEKRPVVLATRLPDGEQRLLPDPIASPALNARPSKCCNRTKAAR